MSDDINIDELFDNEMNFKPLTKGLGFHHSLKEKTEVRTSMANLSKELERDLTLRARQLSESSKGKTEIKDMGDLAPFYNLDDKKSESMKIDFAKEDQIVEQTFYFSRVLAWLVDLCLLISLSSIVFLSTVLVASIPLDFVTNNALSFEYLSLALPIFLMFYVFYFSFFDKTTFSSPGKRLMGLRVLRLNDENISMIQAFARSLISLFSVFTLGLITMLQFHDKLTETKVVRK